jgi:hypothetical protein
MELNYEAKQYYQITVVIEDMKGNEPRGGKASHTFTVTVLGACYSVYKFCYTDFLLL